MEKIIQQFLSTLKKKTVALEQLEQLFGSANTYAEFASTIASFESKGVLVPIKSRGTNGKNPSLALGFRVYMQSLKQDLHQAIAKARIELHPLIQLEPYFTLTYSVWSHDLPYIRLIHSYLERQPLPTIFAPAPERSFELVANEKWITDLGGKELLERIGLWDKLLIMPVSDPIMFAINPKLVTGPEQIHLIVENKTTYQALLPVLQNSTFSTLIYGVGNKIVKSIENFHHQYPSSAIHQFFYFGDIDHEGINIWHKLSKKIQVEPALPFYEAALLKTPPSGKLNQLRNEEALNAFTDHFPDNVRNKILESLAAGFYYPQEIVKTQELQDVWRDTTWK